MVVNSTNVDERTRSNTRYAAAIWLGVTQVLLAGVIFYRLYVIGQPDREIQDFQAVLMISIFGYLALQLYFGGVMPVPTWRGAIAAYLLLTTCIVTGCLIIYGLPPAEDWANTWLPAVLGPALLVCGYAIVARLGQWRIDRQIENFHE